MSNKKKVEKKVKTNSKSNKNLKNQERVRVKTFIVEKPVYVPYKGNMSRNMNENFREENEDYDLNDEDKEYNENDEYSVVDYDSSESRYSKWKKKKSMEQLKKRKEEIESSTKQILNGKNNQMKKNAEMIYGNPDNEEEIDDRELDEENYAESNDLDPPIEDEENYQEVIPRQTQRIRSNGLFNNKWWVKGIIKGFLIWAAIYLVILFLQVLKLVSIENPNFWILWLIMLTLTMASIEKITENIKNKKLF
ncbi:MAG: hypothetical protein PHQ98_02105 [Candidatus ainarchaeum sp.]|nr:hypothetical protein [Candidatus ainarchaeum sp.]